MVATGRLTREGTALRKFALGYPEAHEEMPWGHHAIKVKGKSFVFLAADAETFSLSAKLPSSAGVAVKLPFASPTEYGLGRSGGSPLVSRAGARVPLDMLRLWDRRELPRGRSQTPGRPSRAGNASETPLIPRRGGLFKPMAIRLLFFLTREFAHRASGGAVRIVSSRNRSSVPPKRPARVNHRRWPMPSTCRCCGIEVREQVESCPLCGTRLSCRGRPVCSPGP